MTVRGRLAVLLVTLCLSPFAGAQGPQGDRGLADPLVVETSEGPVRGAMQGDVLVFKGIPFAAAPVGPRRWLPPAPPPARSSVLDALAFGPACPQPRYPGIEVTSEDCLSLNIWTPATSGSHPVLFWMHGGAFLVNSGGNTRFDGTALAQRGVVVVTVNYRLGVMGIFAHPALTAERPAGPLGNFALMDQLAALRWVKQNIAGFGGDSQNVTISGSSAGATSSLFLMTAGPSGGLFQKVIVQSGGGSEAVLDFSQEEAAGSSFGQNLGVPADASAATAAALRALSAESITMANGHWDGPSVPPLAVKPIVDDSEASAEDDANAIIRLTLNDAFVPGGAFLTPAAFLIGSTDGESCGQGCPQGPISSIAAKGAFATDLDRIRAVAATGAKTYLYYYRFVPGKPGESADHGASVEYTFGTATRGDPDAVRISDVMIDYWVSFMSTGVPSSGDGPQWPVYDPEQPDAMVFANAEEGGVSVVSVLPSGVVPPPTSQPVTVEATIPLPSAPHSLFYNPVENKVYSANIQANSITVVDGATNQVLATLPVPAGPRAFGHDWNEGRIFSANYYADNLSVIDTKTDRVVATVPTGGKPRDLVYNPAHRKLYCANETTNDVTVVDGGTLAVIATVPVEHTPRVICYNPTNNTVYCANSASSSVTVIDGATDRAVATVKVGNVPKGIVHNPKNGKLYVSNYGSDTVTVIDAATNTVRGTISVGDGPSGIFYDPTSNKVYCGIIGEPGPGNRADSVVVIDGATDQIVKTLVAEDEPTAFDVLPGPNLLAWINEWSDSVSVVDGMSGSVLQVVEVGRQPVDIVANPLQNRLYVGNGLGKSITVLRAESLPPRMRRHLERVP